MPQNSPLRCIWSNCRFYQIFKVFYNRYDYVNDMDDKCLLADYPLYIFPKLANEFGTLWYSLLDLTTYRWISWILLSMLFLLYV